jgi:hypothetical protein
MSWLAKDIKKIGIQESGFRIFFLIPDSGFLVPPLPLASCGRWINKKRLEAFKGKRHEGPQRSLKVIVAVKGKTQVASVPGSSEKVERDQGTHALAITIFHSSRSGFRNFPHYTRQSAKVQSLFFTAIMRKASLFSPV